MVSYLPTHLNKCINKQVSPEPENHVSKCIHDPKTPALIGANLEAQSIYFADSPLLPQGIQHNEHRT